MENQALNIMINLSGSKILTPNKVKYSLPKNITNK